MFSEEVYDPYIAFHAQASISSTIKPLHILTGILAEVFFGMDGQDGFTPKDGGVWEPTSPSPGMDIYGTGHEPWHFTTEKDAGAFAIAVVAADDAEEGGFKTLYSWESSLRGLKEVYERVHPDRRIGVRERGGIDELESRAVEERKRLGRGKWWEYHRMFFMVLTVRGVWKLGENEKGRYPAVEVAGLEEFLMAHPEV